MNKVQRRKIDHYSLHLFLLTFVAKADGTLVISHVLWDTCDSSPCLVQERVRVSERERERERERAFVRNFP